MSKKMLWQIITTRAFSISYEQTEKELTIMKIRREDIKEELQRKSTIHDEKLERVKELHTKMQV